VMDSVLCSFPKEENNKASELEIAQARFLGLILSDGAIRNNVTFFNKDEYLLRCFEDCCKKLWPTIVLRRSVHKNDVVRIRCSREKTFGKEYHVANLAKIWVREIGILGTDSETKFVPEFVFSYPIEAIKE